FGTWRACVWAFGSDESLFFAYRVESKRAADQAAAQKRHDKGLRELIRSRRAPEELARERERLDRELAEELEQQPQRDRERYRAERWMELTFVLFCVAVGPGFLWAGRCLIRW